MAWNQQHLQPPTFTNSTASTHNAFAKSSTSKPPTLQKSWTLPLKPQTTQQSSHRPTFPPLPNYFTVSHQLQLLGHVLRAPTNHLERHICFTDAFVYRPRGPTTKSGHRRKHWAELTAHNAWFLFSQFLPQHTPHHFYLPYCYLQLHRIATQRSVQHEVVTLPTRSHELVDACLALFSLRDFTGQTTIHSASLSLWHSKKMCIRPCTCLDISD